MGQAQRSKSFLPATSLGLSSLYGKEKHPPRKSKDFPFLKKQITNGHPRLRTSPSHVLSHFIVFMDCILLRVILEGRAKEESACAKSCLQNCSRQGNKSLLLPFGRFHCDEMPVGH